MSYRNEEKRREDGVGRKNLMGCSGDFWILHVRSSVGAYET